MEIRQISFIEVRALKSFIFRKFPIPRVGAVLLSTILKEKGYKVRAFIEDVAEPDWSYIENSDLVCISTITTSAIRAYDIADRLRAKGIPVIMGGVHPSFLPEEALEHSDYVVRGEGDYILPELIESLDKGNPDISSIEGVSYRGKDGTIIHNPNGQLVKDLNNLPDTDFGLVHKWKASNIHPISTSRGCPFNCRFCLVIEMFGGKYRFKSVESTLSELKNIASVSKSTIFFVDDNFAGNKKRTKEMLRGIIEEKMKIKWSAMVRPDIAKDPELLKLMADSGRATACIGFESVNPETLKEYNKKQNVDENIKCISMLKDYGIKIHGMFVLGADSDDVDTIKRTTEFAVKSGIDSVQFMVLTPLPGTKFFHEIVNSKRLLHMDWNRYDIHHVVFRPALMDPKTLHIETLKAMLQFYSCKYILKYLSRFNFFYAAFGIYNKNSIKRALREAEEYLYNIDPGAVLPYNEQPH